MLQNCLHIEAMVLSWADAFRHMTSYSYDNFAAKLACCMLHFKRDHRCEMTFKLVTIRRSFPFEDLLERPLSS